VSDALDIVVVNPWAAGSHLAWAQGWQQASRHRIHHVSHEGRSWRWRMRGAAVTLAEEAVEWGCEHGAPNLVVATDMLDLPVFLALIRRTAPHIRSVVYMHENQLCYPRQPGEPLDQGLAWTTWCNVVVADSVWFNSEFHRSSFLDALPEFLGSVADHDHLHLIDVVAAKSRVVPVGVDIAAIRGLRHQRATPGSTPLVLSNHRWHHDKDVGAILRALRRLADAGVAFRLAIAGDHEGGCRDELMPLIEGLGDHVESVGHQSRAAYLDLLDRADIVVSAARNEFFGVSVVEAVAAGAIPVLPNSLAYPEVIPSQYHEAVLYEPGGLTEALRRTIEELDELRVATSGLAESMSRFSIEKTVAAHDVAATDVVRSASSRS